MFLTLLFYAGVVIGEAACIAYAINVLHGYPWRSRWTEEITLVALAAIGLGSLELARRYWFVPVSSWPTSVAALAGGFCLIGFVGVPAAQLSRSLRSRFVGVIPSERREELQDLPREEFIGDGHHAWLLRLPGNRSLDLEAHDFSVAFPQLPDEMNGLSVLHLTDLHFSRAYDRRYFQAVCEAAADMPSDIVLVTGDMVDDPACIEWIAPLLKDLPGPLGKFAILGNHDHFHDSELIAAALTEAGFRVLDGETTLVDVEGRRLAVGGTCAPWGPPIPDDAVPSADFSLLMSHTPDQVYKSAKQGWDFILTGHNHGGQIRFPLIGPLLMPSVYSRRFDRGFFRIRPSLMYVSQGIGAKHPIRYGCVPEITRFTLVRSEATARRDLAASSGATKASSCSPT
ncbi:metallophosphoesterase [Paludisphaera rhizosphaerae]|uniref:metallophosphoesterase n=1 Tax=Paludisphaera rhizosphaerae TaxID=2711216 RepID=UPI0013EA2BAB|nr:metallophosphoesterase [Paludisphaera rhizosphaerae]